MTYVGDTMIDMRAAESNNLEFVYASYGLGRVLKYKYKLNNFSDLLDLCNI